MNEYSFFITNLTCGACRAVCVLILKKIDGVATVDIGESGLTKIVSTKPLDIDHARNVLKEKGYESITAS